MSKILLVGGAGYIGLVVADHLLRGGHSIRILDNLIYGHNRPALAVAGKPGLEFHNGDLRDRAVLDAALAGMDHVVILAGLVGDPITKKYPELSGSINDDGIAGCIDALNGKGLQRVIFVSTCSNYGLMPEGSIADETSELRPLSLYSKSKVAAEQRLLATKGSTDYQPTILRFATAFGLAPRMRFDLTVNEFAVELASGQELVVFDADTWRPYCHVQDFARLIETVLAADAAKVGFEVFNAGGEVNNFTKRMIVEQVLALVPEGKVSYQANGGDPRNYRVDFTKVRSTLGFVPSYTVAQGIEEVVRYTREGVFADFRTNRETYGNYVIEHD